MRTGVFLFRTAYTPPSDEAVSKFHGVRPKTAVKMRALRIEMGADLRRQPLSFLQDHFGKAGSWYYDIVRGRDDRSVQPTANESPRDRKRLFQRT
jgi:nucleotidyltransferase/DNA polymerase involved in DNA repair